MGGDLGRLGLVASAVAGCPLEVAEAEAGGLAWTDGSTIYLPVEASDVDHVLMLAVQASLVAAGSLDPAVVRSLLRRPGLARRYLAVEANRALAANDEVLPPAARRLLHTSVAPGVTTAEGSLDVARGRAAIDDAPPVFGTIDARRLLAATARSEAAGAVPGSAPVAREAAALVELADDDADDDFGAVPSNPVGGGGSIGRLLSRLMRPARKRGGGGPPGADSPTHVTSAPRGGQGRVVVSGAPRGVEAATTFVRQGTSYPEWDVHRRRYRPAWCTVSEIDPPAGAVPATRPDGAALRRPLARLGIGLTRCRRRPQGDDIDIDAAVEARVDALAGSPHDDTLYVENLRRRRDLSVLVLLDVSGSAGEPGTGGRSVHEHQREVAASLTAALHELGDRVALHAFNSRGREAVQLLRVKAFDDHLDGAMAGRLAALAPGGYTRLGAAIRHGAAILDDHGGTSRRLLVVLSDGLAYDHGYEGRYAEADARRALVEARRAGVGCLCLSVGTAAEPAALRRVFGAAAHATVPRAGQLPGLIGPLFRSALRSAEAQRRAFQRQARTRGRHEVERRSHDAGDTAVLSARR